MALTIQVTNYKECHLCKQMIDLGTECTQKLIELDGELRTVHEHIGGCPISLFEV